MPLNKNASFRYRVIDKCLQNTGRQWTLENIREEISKEMFKQFGDSSGISERTVYSDMNIMKSGPPRGFDAPIEFDRERQTYKYAMQGYTILNIPFNEEDIANLHEAVGIMQQFKGLPLFEELASLIQKIEHRNFQHDTLDQKHVVFEYNPHAQGIKFLDQIYRAIHQESCLTIQYQPFDFDKPYDVAIHPYLLKEYRNRWFLLALDNASKKIINCALDRIQSIGHSSIHFVENTCIDHDTYFKHVIGVTVPEDKDIKEIRFVCEPLQARYIKTKPLHSSQKLCSETKNGVEFSINVIPNYELESVLLGFGETVKVVSPGDFAKKIQKRLKEAYMKY